jgi:hypothetical protein
MRAAMSDLKDLLSRLAHAPKRATTYLGTAVGKDDNNLHLAVTTGVIAIPIAAITDVKHLGTGIENAVSVEVSDASKIKQILKVSPLEANIVPPGQPGGRDPIAASGTYTFGGGTTATASAPDPGLHGITWRGDDTHDGQRLDDVIYT